MSFSSTQLNTFQSCPKRYKFRYVDNLRKIEEGKESVDRNWGKGIHEGLAVLYKGGAREDIHKAFMNEYPVALDEGDMAKTPESGLQCLDLYMDYWKEEDKKWKILDVETFGDFELNDTKFVTRLDLIAEHVQGSGIYFWDHKTTGKSLTFNFWSQFEMNSQVTAYTKYVSLKHGQCSGAIINGISIGFRKRGYRGLPPGFHCTFERQIFNRNKEQIADWESNIQSWRDSIKWCGETGNWGKFEGRHCQYCDYKEICTSCDNAEIVKQLYEVKEYKDD